MRFNNKAFYLELFLRLILDLEYIFGPRETFKTRAHPIFIAIDIKNDYKQYKQMNYQQFKLHFKEPIYLKNKHYAYKEGLYLLLNDKIQGEASPLPGFSQESMTDLLKEIPNLNFSKILEITDPYFDYSTVTKIKCLQFALSMFVNQKLFQDIDPHTQKLTTDKINKKTTDITLDKSSGTRSYLKSNTVKVQNLLQGDSANIRKRALAIAFENKNEIVNDKNNSVVVKMKVGRNSLMDEKKDLQFIIENSNLKIRLDANQSWRLSQALDFLKDIPKERIAYLEEPLQNPKELELLYSKTQIPFALDENIQVFRNIPLKGLKALILKPTLLGDLKSLRDLISDYTRGTSDLELIVSSSYESQVGLDYLKTLALRLNPEGWHGLDTENAISQVEIIR